MNGRNVMATRPGERLEVISGLALLKREIPEPPWVIEDVLPQGLALLVAKSKSGKSWLAMSFAVGVAHGGSAMGNFRCGKGEVLYADLENPLRRTKYRLQRTLDRSTTCPAGLYFTNRWPLMDQGALDRLREWLDAHPRTKLVIIDTVAKVWPSKMKGAGTNAYYAEYQLLASFKDLADERGICLLLLHHESKMDRGDPLDRVSGTAAFVGAPDAILMFDRKRGQDESDLYITGREVKEREIRLRFNMDAGNFTLIGEGP